jgi:hypothetical protein
MWITWAILQKLMKNMVNFKLSFHYLVAISIIEKRFPIGKLTK